MMKTTKMVQSLFLLFSLLLLSLFNSAAGQYEGLRLVRIYISTQTQLKGVTALSLDVWSGGSKLVIGYNDILMQDQNIVSCWNLGIPVEMLSIDVGTGIEREGQELEQGFGTTGFGDDWFNSYHNYDEIYGFLGIIAGDNSDLVTYNENIGTTYEGRYIPAVTVTGLASGPKEKIIVIGGLQGREWISPATVLYICNKLVQLYRTDSTIKSLLDQLSISFIPLANPDGYDYSWTTSRFWRKNRKLNSDNSFGVDLNRNFDDHWGCSSSPSSNTFCGISAFSELETQAIRDFVIANGPFSGSVDFTGYSQNILRPYSWTKTGPLRDPLFKSIADNWVQTMNQNSVGATYTVQNAFSVFNTTGNVRDWLFSEANVAASFTVQLRDDGSYAFLLPPAQILPTGIEHLEGFKYFLRSVISLV